MCLSIRGRTRAAVNLDTLRAADVSAVSASFSLSPSLQVLYRWNRQSSTSVIETNKTSVELSLPFDEDYIIEIKPFSDGGDGSSSEQIRIPKISSKDGRKRVSACSGGRRAVGSQCPQPLSSCLTPITVCIYRQGRSGAPELGRGRQQVWLSPRQGAEAQTDPGVVFLISS